MTEPRTAPCLASASAANAEQLGAKRQAGGRNGAATSWYARTAAIRRRAAGPGRSRSTVEVEALRELGGRLGIREGVRTGLRYHHDVRRWLDLVLPAAEDLAEESLHAVPDDRVADPLADRHTESGPRSRRGTPDEDQMARVPTSSLALQREVLRTPADPRRLRVGTRSHEGDHPGCFGGMLTVSRLRPLSRRRLST